MLSMAACFPVYGPDAVRERATELWEGIKTEVCHPCTQDPSAYHLADPLLLRHDNRSVGTICVGISGRYTLSNRSRHSSGTRTGYHKAMSGYSAGTREKSRHRCNKSSGSAFPRFSSVVWDLELQLSRNQPRQASMPSLRPCPSFFGSSTDPPFPRTGHRYYPPSRLCSSRPEPYTLYRRP